MSAPKVVKSTPVEQRPARLTARTVTGAPPARKSRASSCPRCPQRARCEGRSGAQDPALRKTRSSSTAPRTTSKWPRTNPDHRRETGAVKHAAAAEPKCRNMSSCPGPRENRGLRAETRPSPKAFTVIPPNPEKRREIQRKAEAELAALEELRLSRAMAFVSINPSSVGGCMSLEEVRLKQQQEMMQAKRKQKPIKRQVIEQTPVLKC